jgi:hypothetical protein
MDWSLTSGASEGTYNLNYDADPSNGTTRTINLPVIVDGTNPTGWTNFIPASWTTDTTPNCSIQVRDLLSGLSSTQCYYWYYDGVVNGPFAAGFGGVNGTTLLTTLSANNVPFNIQSQGTQAQMYFRAYDRAGNFSDSGWQNVYIDSVPPGSWANFSPAGFVYDTTPDCSVQVQDVTSGLAIASAEYRYSTNNGGSYSAYIGCGVSGANGSTAVQTMTALGVPFNQVSATQNRIQFRITDIAGNVGTSPSYLVRTGAIIEHNAAAVAPGATIAGSDANLFASDDVRWEIRPGVVLVSTQDPVGVILSGTAPGTAPSALTVTVETSASTGAANIRQIVEARNFTSGTWTNLETFSPLPSGAAPDRSVTLNVPLANHIGPGNEVRIRLLAKANGPVLVYPWRYRIDRQYWTYTPS